MKEVVTEELEKRSRNCYPNFLDRNYRSWRSWIS